MKPTNEEVSFVRALLQSYKQMQRVITEFEKYMSAECSGEFNVVKEKQQRKYEYSKKVLEMLDHAIALIEDDDTREMIEYRFKKGNTRKMTTINFYLTCERNVDRKVKRGVEIITGQIKEWGFALDGEATQ